MGSGYKDFQIDEVLASADVDNYLMRQTVMHFNSAAARDAAITAPEEGMHAYLRDQNYDTVYTGSSWVIDDPTPPMAVLRQTTTAQTIQRETDAAITFNTEDFDTHNGHSTTTNTSRYTAPRAGIYRVTGVLPWQTLAVTATFIVYFKVNNSTLYAGSSLYRHNSNSNVPVTSATALMSLNAGDYVEMWAWFTAQFNDSSVPASMDTAVSYQRGPRMEIEWLRQA